jgi:hypothetical protein
MDPQDSKSSTTLSYHGLNDKIFYIYKSSEKPANLNYCDFIDPPELVCSNYTKGNKCYRC